MVVSNNITGDLDCSGLQLNNRRQKLRQRFDILRKLGQGTYGKVQLALNKETGEEVAIKTIKKAKIETEQDLIRIQREIQIMSSIQHPYIIHIYEVFENKEKIVLVMEYACGGEMYDFLNFKKTLSESEARRIFRQISSAVYYCHKNKICHRDLKLENILLDEKGNAKIADFGLSNNFNESKLLNTFCGSPLYASPEIVKGNPYYGPEVDCWSLGVLLYTLVYGAMPFDGSNFRRLVKQISEGDYYEPKKPSEASMLIRRLLTVSPSKRATIEDVCEDWWVNLSYDDSLLAVAEELGKVPLMTFDYVHQSKSSDTANEESTKKKKKSRKAEENSSLNSTSESNLSIQNEQNTVNVQTEQSSTTETEQSSTIETEQSSTTETENEDIANQKLTNCNDENLISSLSEVKENENTENTENNESLDTKQPEIVQKEEKPVIEENQAKNISQDEKTELNVPCDDHTSHLESNVESIAAENIVAQNNEVGSEVLAEKINIEPTVTAKQKPSSESCDETNVEIKPKLKQRSASLKTTSLSTGIKEKKSFVFPGLRVSEAKLAFENKQADKKVKTTVPGLKVSTAKKVLETANDVSCTASRRASMPAKLKIIEPDNKPVIKASKQSPSRSDGAEIKQKEAAKPQKKTAGFLPTLDVTVAVKPRKDLGKPPPFPRVDASTSGTSSGENTPDIVIANLPFRRSSCPKSNSSTASCTSERSQNTEPRQRSLSNASDVVLSLTSGDSSLKSSSSTLTGNESSEALAGSASHTDANRVENSEATAAVDDLNTRQEDAKSSSNVDVPDKVTKRSSMEIQLSSNTSQPEVKSAMAEPQFILRKPPGGGKFTLLGVTSEVSFDVAAAPEVEIPTVEVKAKPHKISRNLFMSVTLPPPPPPSDCGSDNDEAATESNKPTIESAVIQQKAHNTITKQQKSANHMGSPKRNISTQNHSDRYLRDLSKNPETLLSGRQGYNVYRSKFRGLQKAGLSEQNRWSRDVSLERSESFSSTGSIDDMEEVYDCFAPGGSQGSIDELPLLSRQHSYSKKLPNSDLKMDTSIRYEDTSSPMSSGFGSSRSTRPQIYDRSCSNSRSSWSSVHFKNSASSNSVKDYGSDAESLVSDSSSRNQWSGRNSSQDAKDSNDLSTKSLYRYKTRCSSLSRSMSEDESPPLTEHLNSNQDPSSSSLSARYLGNSSTNRISLSSRFRNEKSKVETTSTTSPIHKVQSNSNSSPPDSASKLPYYPYNNSFTRRRSSTRSSDDTMLNNTTEGSQPSNYRSDSIARKDSFDYSIYGTTRRTRDYNKSVTQDLVQESKKVDIQESVPRRRPRSLILSDSEWSSTKQAQSDKRENPFRIHRAASSGEKTEESSDIKKKLDRDLESQYTSPSVQKNLRAFWRAGSHGREIGTGLNTNKSIDGNKPTLMRRASLSEDSKGRLSNENYVKNSTLPSGAAEYWARRYGTNSRIHPATENKVEESLTDTNSQKSEKKIPIRRRSTAGLEKASGNETDDERTRGLLQYARSISHELNQLHNDLTTTFRKRKEKECDVEINIQNEVGNVVNELKKLEDDLILLGASPKRETNSVKKEVVNEVKPEKKPRAEELECGSSEDGTATPTDQDDTCSLCSDYENRSGASSGLEESVSERIRRKSYFARFQDKKNKSRTSNQSNGEARSHCHHCRIKAASESNAEPDKPESGRQQTFSCSRHSMPRDVRYNNIDEETVNKSGADCSDSPNNYPATVEDSDNEATSNHIADGRSGRASSVAPESPNSTYSKSFYRHHSTSDFLRPISPVSRRLSMLDSTSSNGYMSSGWSKYDRRKTRPSTSIISSLPLEATVHSRANLRSRHDYLINRALSSLDDRNARPLTPNSRRVSFRDNYMTDMRRFSAILDNSSPRDVIRKALDIL